MKNQLKSLKSFANEITWPSVKTVKENMKTVLITSAALAAFVSLVDFTAGSMVSMLLSVF